MQEIEDTSILETKQQKFKTNKVKWKLIYMSVYYAK